jgi:hypothetical protein
MIAAAMEKKLVPLKAETFLREFSGASSAVLLRCKEGQECVVKGNHLRREIIAEQVVGRLGSAIGASVGDVTLVDVPPELIRINPKMQHMPPGLSHGSHSLLAEVNEDKKGIENQHLPANRSRFSLLAVLYGLFEPSDIQLFYRKRAPELVHSFDHAYFFPGSQNWTATSLRAAGPAWPATPFAGITSACAITATELGGALRTLENVTPATVAEAVAVPPAEWGFEVEERVATAEYVYRRRSELLRCLPPNS